MHLDSDTADVLAFEGPNRSIPIFLAAMTNHHLTAQVSGISPERAFSEKTDLGTSDRCSFEGMTI